LCLGFGFVGFGFRLKVLGHVTRTIR